MEFMTLSLKCVLSRIDGRKGIGWSVCGIALLSFAAGSLLTARWMHLENVKADSHRVFQLEIYHAVPGKVFSAAG
jgi:hypothetical protein